MSDYENFDYSSDEITDIVEFIASDDSAEYPGLFILGDDL